MRIVLDTNVFVSGVFFGGVPGRILDAWRDARVRLVLSADILEAPDLPEPVSADPDDDKFLACAIAAGVAVIVSGDKDLLDQSGWRSVRVLRPRQFADEFLLEV